MPRVSDLTRELDCRDRGYHSMVQTAVVSGEDGTERHFRCEDCGLIPGENCEVTFHNVTVTMMAETPDKAYTKLCAALDGFEYVTDSYSTDDDNERRSTDRLYLSERAS